MTKRPAVLFAAAELTPLAKVGGIADVVGALPIALRQLGVDVRVILPKYEVIDAPRRGFRPVGELSVTVNERVFPVRIWEGMIPHTDVGVILLESVDFLSTGQIYFEQQAAEGSFAEFRRFLFYDLAVYAWLQQSGWAPDILHCHDWQTGLLPALVGNRLRTVFTIHNLAMQGKWNAQEIIRFLQLDERQHPSLTLRDRDGDLNLAAIGIANSDRVTTVSPSYAQEILTPDYGLGLDGLLREHRTKLTGILNGIDTVRFNPASDPAIAPYNATTLDRKIANHSALLKKLNLRGKGPTFGFIGRLTDQKGIDLIAADWQFFHESEANFILLGKGLSQYESMAAGLLGRLPGQASITIGFDARLAQQIYGGVDFFLMPSRFEPCGLTQLIALRYGTVPVVRATGGLKDTVRDVNFPDGTGIVFNDYDPGPLRNALDRAAALYANPAAYRAVQTRGMAKDFSWNASAIKYAALYRDILR